MLGLTRIFSKKPGLSPGSLVHVGEKKVEKARLRIIDYDEDNFEERELEAVEECFPYKDKADKERCLEVLRKAELK